MGIYTELYPEQEPVFIEGDGQFQLDVIASPDHQNYLKSLCGGYSLRGSKLQVVAKLHYDNCNPEDKNAIRVVINGGTVGYLSPEHAMLFRERIRITGQEGIIVSCNAQVVGGRKFWFFRKTGFSVRIDLPIQQL